jgi:hypothetical protein
LPVAAATISCKETKPTNEITLSFANLDERLIPFHTEYLLSCIVMPEDAPTATLEWTSNNPDVQITSQSGNACTLLGVAQEAAATITVSAGTHNASIAVKVDRAEEDPLAVTLDTRMLSLLFPPQKDVLTAADGAISIEAGDNKSYWLWGDFFMGEVKDNKRISGTQLISGNAMTLLDGEISTTFCGGTPQNPQSFLTTATETINGYKTIVWPGHGFVKNNIVHVFMSVFLKTGSGGLDITFYATYYYRLNQSNLSVIDVTDLDVARQSGIHLGYGVLEHDGYYYTYGNKDLGALSYPPCIARAKLVNDKLTDWEVFNGAGWSTNFATAATMQGFTSFTISEQHSVFKYGNKFIFLTQSRFNGDIYTFVADYPEGPWGNRKKHYTTPERSDSRYTTYNAMAHPQYAANGKLLVSYCVNSSTLAGLNNDVMSYRPRFIWVPYTLILN